MSYRKKPFEIQVHENPNSREHPWYARMYVDEYLVADKSFKNGADAEKAKIELMHKTIVDLTRKLRNLSELYDKMEDLTIDHPKRGDKVGFGHYDD